VQLGVELIRVLTGLYIEIMLGVACGVVRSMIGAYLLNRHAGSELAHGLVRQLRAL